MAATNVQSGDGVTSELVSPVMVTSSEYVGDDFSDGSPVKVVSDGGGGVGGGGNNNVSRKLVWNKVVNGAVDVVSPVMGAAWPALGESTKPTMKSSSSESLKALSDGSVSPSLQVTGSSSPKHKQANVNDMNLNSSSTTNHVAPSRQRSMKRGGGGGNSSVNVSSSNGVVNVTQPPPVSEDSVVELEPLHNNTSGKPGNGSEQVSPKEHAHKESPKGGFGSQFHSGSDHHYQRGSFRRGNGGGSYHSNYGGKRDNDRGEWNQHSRSFNNRDTHMQPQRGFSRGYVRPTVHTPASFIPVPVPSFGNNMMYPEVAPPVVYVSGPAPPAMPFGAPQVYFAGHDPLLYATIVNQIDYYFSNENLVKDTYLRRNMDDQGWVSINLIAGFKKVSYLTDNVQLILDAMRTSTVVEVQGDKIRRRNDWMKWIMPAPGQYSNPSSPHANHEGLMSQVQGLALNEPASTNQVHSVKTYLSMSSSEELTGGEENVGVTGQQARFDHATAA